MARYVFVYGTLRSGGRLNFALVENGATLLAKGAEVPGFTLYENGAFPMAVPSTMGTIRGEVWKLPEEPTARNRTLEHLDQVEGVPFLYRREEVVPVGMAALVYLYVWNRDAEGLRYVGREWRPVAEMPVEAIDYTGSR